MVREYPPPGPTTQKINALLHKEPFASISYGLIWSALLLVATPIAVLILGFATIFKLIVWYLGTWENVYDPAEHSDKELAVVITGCDSGFGKEIAYWASDAGFVVFAGCLTAQSLEQFQQGPRAIIAAQMDVTKDSDVSSMATKVDEWLQAKKGRVLHAIINNAGIGCLAGIDWLEVEDFYQVMDVNFFGIIRTVKAFLPRLKQQALQDGYRGARILNMVSVAGLVSSRGFGAAPYFSSKRAAQCFSQCLRYELQPFHVQVGTINPTCHGTPLVLGAVDAQKRKWMALSEKNRREYGEEFLEVQLDAIRQTLALSWNVDVVVDRVVQSLKRKYVPTMDVVGIDGKFLFLGIGMWPSWLQEGIFNWMMPCPVPAIAKVPKH